MKLQIAMALFERVKLKMFLLNRVIFCQDKLISNK
jgi:hypothetical protein